MTRDEGDVATHVGFCIPVLLTPIAFGARYLVADQGDVTALLIVNSCDGVLGLLASILLVVALWLALNRD